jgi:hypothetical protein
MVVPVGCCLKRRGESYSIREYQNDQPSFNAIPDLSQALDEGGPERMMLSTERSPYSNRLVLFSPGKARLATLLKMKIIAVIHGVHFEKYFSNVLFRNGSIRVAYY